MSRPFLPAPLLTCLLLLTLLAGCAVPAAGEPDPAAAPPVEAGAVATGTYPNLFAEAGYAPAEIRARVESAFAQLFHGDPAEEAIHYEDGANDDGPLAYILDVNSEDVRSEGMSYGMMIAVQLDRKREFDAIWNWAMSHMYHADPAHPAHGYFAWSVRSDGTAIDEMPAPDGEGLYDYRAHADRLLHDVLHRQPITGPTNRGPMTAVNLFDHEAKMVRFTPDLVNASHTDASYHLPAFYEIWARMGPEADRAFWRAAAQVSRDYFVSAAHPVTALTPDYGNFDGSPWAASWRPESADFRYDAWRSAMNWSMDWSWWRADPRQVGLSNRLQGFFLEQGLDRHASLYTLDGQPLGGERAPGLVAMNATASLAADHPRRLEFVRALWEQPLPTGRYRYYDGVLQLMALLHLAGEYRVWLPEGSPPE